MELWINLTDQPTLLASIIIPIRNEAPIIVEQLEKLQALRAANIEIILVDGDSQDNSIALAAALVDKVLSSRAGRAVQMNVGAAEANGQYLVFLHIDTQLPHAFLSCIKDWQQQQVRWGFFPVKLSSRNWQFRIIEKAINWRSKLSGIGTGDQVIFCHQKLFTQIGGFEEIPLMEDVAICQRLKKLAPPKIQSRTIVTTSARRWEANGIASTIMLMWRLRAAYFFGVQPEKLVRRYYR